MRALPTTISASPQWASSSAAPARPSRDPLCCAALSASAAPAPPRTRCCVHEDIDQKLLMQLLLKFQPEWQEGQPPPRRELPSPAAAPCSARLCRAPARAAGLRPRAQARSRAAGRQPPAPLRVCARPAGRHRRSSPLAPCRR
ncbi:hypothetical protein BS78_02G154000 [Paspalum vaginatum]|nr:hypothetical protein BS78_02G154000 [Paspalum vaginatum]KAJ1289303.1 hypothetical protein BS78_02G154000 [Paspalum vaginatum]KAJ1289304.1 hypothetical protein BS78_02G154000 [Paspalum vaginatum]KAJ1289305.1 hypothetical protein BS78_02G154000 [Paspalum vaginatum]KAJ1289306.1 hypothetical protein BS78_02G154000 [Paspalum vaginatum]